MIVVAVPTIEERGDAWQDVAEVWYATCSEPLVVVPSWRKGTWAAGLNEVWELHPDAEVFVCSSDDMLPEPDWFPVVLEHLKRDQSPVPLMYDRGRCIYGGSEAKVRNGTKTGMSNFPVLKSQWLPKVFPLDPEMHYFADNEISDRLHAIKVPTVFAEGFVVRHTADERGRGAGMGDEPTRMRHDRKLYLKNKNA